MSFRTRVQVGVVLGAAALVAAGLTSVAQPATARPAVDLPATPAVTVAKAAAPKTATTKAAKTPAPDCGGVTFRKANGTAWKCTFADSFNGTKLDTSKWKVMTSAQFNFGKRNDCFVPGNAKVLDGNLVLVARREKASFKCERGNGTYKTQYTAGMVSTYKHFDQTYGRFEFRAKFPYTQQKGLQTSSWLWPSGASGATWPSSGEIDVAEWYSQYEDRVIPYLHYSGLNGGAGTNRNCLVNRVQDWHTYLLEWGPKYLRISYDAKTCLVLEGVGAPFNKDYFMAMFHGFGLKGNAPSATTPGYTRAYYAWVRAWS